MQTLNNLNEVSDYLNGFYKNARTKYTLDNIKAFLEFVGNPQNKYPVIHLAGTSGKTSTSYFIASLIRKTGAKTGLTVSPHIEKLTERVQVDGKPIDEKVFCAQMTTFLGLVEDSEVKLSWFEIMVAFAFWYFAEIKVDYAVIEVGLGGLKDGTNVIDDENKVCVITDIGYDHVNILGNDIASIAAQKAGIIGEKNAVFTHKQDDEIIEVIKNEAQEKDATLLVIEPESSNDTEMSDYQARNWQLAYVVYRYVAIRDGLEPLGLADLKESQSTYTPGRMEIIKSNGKTIIFDGAHNQQKFEAFISSFKKLYPNQKPAVLLAIKEGKNIEEIAPMLDDLAASVIVTEFTSSQDLPIESMKAEEVAEYLDATVSFQIEPDYKQAYKDLTNRPEDILVVTGSLYLIGLLRSSAK